MAGDKTLWSGPAGEDQLILSALNTACLARNFREAGFDVTIADFLTEASLSTYRSELPDCFVIHLQISREGARERTQTRPVYLSDSEFKLLHEMIASPPAADVVCEVEGLSLPQQLEVIRAAWRAT